MELAPWAVAKTYALLLPSPRKLPALSKKLRVAEAAGSSAAADPADGGPTRPLPPTGFDHSMKMKVLCALCALCG